MLNITIRVESITTAIVIENIITSDVESQSELENGKRWDPSQAKMIKKNARKQNSIQNRRNEHRRQVPDEYRQAYTC